MHAIFLLAILVCYAQEGCEPRLHAECDPAFGRRCCDISQVCARHAQSECADGAVRYRCTHRTNFGPTSLAYSEEYNHKENAEFTFYDGNANEVPLPSSLTTLFTASAITSGQNPENNVPSHSIDDATLKLTWNVGRKDSAEVSAQLNATTASPAGVAAPLLTLTASKKDYEQNGTLFPKSANLMLAFSLAGIPLSGNRLLCIPSLVAAQTHKPVSLKQLFDIAKNLAEAGYDVDEAAAAEEAGDEWGTFKEGFEAFDKANTAVEEIEALFANPWVLTQSNSLLSPLCGPVPNVGGLWGRLPASFGPNKAPSNFVLVASGVVSYPNGTRYLAPVSFFQAHSSDSSYQFGVIVPF